MEPVTTVTTAWSIAKTAGEISKKLYELGKSLKDREAQHHVDEILDKLRDLKQSASELEDENRELRERLRFKSDHYEFRVPFWYAKDKPAQALCPKCFVEEKTAPIGDPHSLMQGGLTYRYCLACNKEFTLRNGTYS